MTYRTLIKRTIILFLGGLILGFALPPLATQAVESPFTQDGPYQVGVQIMQLNDTSRDNRPLQTYIWYPAIISKDGPRPSPPDTGGAPYPLIIYSHRFQGQASDEVGNYLFKRLASQGFIVVASDHKDTDTIHALIDRPLDVLFVLNQIANLKDNPLVGMIDTDNVGVIGLSMGGYTSIAVGGALTNSGSLTDWCSTNTNNTNFDSCSLDSDWDELLTYHDQLESPAKDGLWPATTDNRIRAILPIEACFGQWFGDKGLAAVMIPTLVMSGTDDEVCPYDIDAAYIYAYLGSEDRYLLSVDKRNHYTLPDEKDLIQHYVSAFFGLYLQGRTDYAQYLMPESAYAFQDATLEAQIGGSN